MLYDRLLPGLSRLPERFAQVERVIDRAEIQRLMTAAADGDRAAVDPLFLGTSSAVGIAVGFAATRDTSPHRFAGGALSTALLAGLLGCGTVGFVGALGVVVGSVAGGVTGWVVAGRAATA